MWIMVGLDQWIAIDGREPLQLPGQPSVREIGHLATRGLSGCVGLALGWEGGQIALAHVFSGCTDGTGKPPGPNTWDGPNGYRAKLDHALAMTQAAIPGATEQKYRLGILVFSESDPTRTVELLADWLESNGIEAHTRPGFGGCDVSASPDDRDEMSVSKPSLLTNYLIAPVENGLTWGLGGQMIACEKLSILAHAADPPQGGS